MVNNSRQRRNKNHKEYRKRRVLVGVSPETTKHGRDGVAGKLIKMTEITECESHVQVQMNLKGFLEKDVGEEPKKRTNLNKTGFRVQI